MKKAALFASILYRITTVCLIALVVGYFTDQYLICILIALLGLLVWFNYNLIRLNDWLWHKKNLYPPKGSGIWAQIFDGIYRLQSKNRIRRKEQGQLLKRFRDGIEALPDAAVVIQKNGQIIWCNKLAAQVFGLKWPSDSGLIISNLIRNPVFVEYIAQAKQDEIANDETLMIPSPIIRDATIEIRVVPYALNQYLILGRDVTQVQKLMQMRKDFIANVSHELRTPLTVLQGYLEMMDDPDMFSPQQSKKAVDMMSQQCERMFNLVNQLLVLSRIEANRDNIFEYTVDVPNLLTVLEQEAQLLNVDHQHTITFSVDKSIQIHGIEEELRSAFTNLVKNAIRYTPSGGKIDIVWALSGNSAKFSVTDNGDGIEAQHISRLTERFYRIDKARSRTTGGSGLGLSIVKHVLAHHKSTLEIESSVTEGSCFYFKFPADMIVK